ncbi:MAG: hypothetical protein ACR2NU_11015 [Aeoliella sp.]
MTLIGTGLIVRLTCYSVAILTVLPYATSQAEEQGLARAAEYLWSQQSHEGGWHSAQYGVLRSGQALTPFVLHALLQVPEEVFPRPEGGEKRAFRYLYSLIENQGHLGHADPEVAEYPVYSTAYALRCLLERDATFVDDITTGVDGIPRNSAMLNSLVERRRILVEQMESFLESAQFTESNGFDPKHVAYGGWGFDKPLQPGEPGHMDLAHTRRALEAIACLHQRHPVSSETHSDRVFRPIVQRAEVFLRTVQKYPGKPTLPFDGGFYFSPVVHDANKGRLEEEPAPHWRSYATATCDGILALLAAGVPRDDPRVAAAVKWLEEHTDVNYPQGVPTDHPEPWGEAIRFYHYTVRAEVYRKLNYPADERASLAAALLKHQRADGSFVNDVSPLMKEDDPMLCTALAVEALANCQP